MEKVFYQSVGSLFHYQVQPLLTLLTYLTSSKVVLQLENRKQNAPSHTMASIQKRQVKKPAKLTLLPYSHKAVNLNPMGFTPQLALR